MKCSVPNCEREGSRKIELADGEVLVCEACFTIMKIVSGVMDDE